MNELVIPPDPNWYLSSIFTCAPDNTCVYGSRRDLVIINPKDFSEPAEIKQFLAHNDKITAVAVNSLTWDNPDRLAVSVSDDRIVKIWNLKTCSLVNHHKAHEKNSDVLVGVSFAGERIISVSETGYIIVWQYLANKIIHIADIFGQKVKVQCMSSCPSASWLTAFGLASGLVIVADLRRNGQIKYKLRGNENEITSLAWCPCSYNIFKTSQRIKIENVLKTKNEKKKYLSDIKTNNGITDDQTKDTLNKTDPTNSTENISNINEDLIVKNDLINDETETNTFTENLNIIKEETVVNKEETESNKEEIVDDVSVEENDRFETGEDPNDAIFGDQPKYEERQIIVYEKIDKTNPWGNIQFNDDDSFDQEDEARAELNDYVQECVLLKNKMLGEEDGNSSLELIKEDGNELNCSVEDEKTSLNDLNQGSYEKKLEENVDNNEGIDEKPEKEYLLASACKKGLICIWRAGTDGRMQLLLPPIPNKNSNRQRKYDKNSRWITLCWAKPELLISSSLDHNVYSWDLLPEIEIEKKLSKSAIFKPHLIHNDHRNTIFNITVPYQLYKYEERENWLTKYNISIWTTSQDRWILCTSLERDRKTKLSYPCFGGYITALAVSHVDPNRLAIGGSDAKIRLWNMSLPQTQVLTMSNLWNKIKSRVTSLDWHPVKEHLLAFATSEGRVGEFDVSNISKDTVIFSNYHRNNVYKIQWGPLPDAVDGIYGLYSCSDGELVVHNASKPTAEARKIPIPNCQVTTFAWKSDYSVFAVGTKEGQVKLLTRKLVHVETIYMQKKTIQCVAWHPPSTVCDSGVSLYANYLAVCSNESTIYVYNYVEADNKTSESSSELVATLKGHTSGVKCISWSPHSGGLLASCSDDGSSMIWDVKSQTVISTLQDAKKDAISCILWSPKNPDLIISGDKNNSFRIWSISKNPPLILESVKKGKKKTKKLKDDVEENETDNSSEITRNGVQKISRTYVLPLVSKLQNFEHGQTVKTCEKLLVKLDEANLENHESEDEFLSADEEHQEDDNQETKSIGNNYSDFIDPVQLFGSKKDMMSLLDLELKKGKKKTKKLKDDVEENETDNSSEITRNGVQKISRTYVLPLVSKLQNFEHGQTVKTCEKLLVKLDEANLENHESEDEFLSADEEHQEDDNQETKSIGNNYSDFIDPVQLFGSKKDMMSLLDLEQGTHIKKKHWDSSHHISLWRGDLQKSIDKAVKAGVLNPWIISMAPMISHKYYQDLCQIYADKLTEEGRGLMASSYYLVCHKVHKAVDALCKCDMYREALALAKCRLSSDDPVVKNILEKWTQFATLTGSFEIAAQCCIKLGKLSEAGELLNKRDNFEALEMAAKLANRSKNTDLFNSVNTKIEILKKQKIEETNDELQYPVINICESRFEALMSSQQQQKLQLSAIEPDETSECENETTED